MKKRIVSILIIAFALIGTYACQDSSQNANSTSKDSISTDIGGSEYDDPEFPDNSFNKDNEVNYPDAWK